MESGETRRIIGTSITISILLFSIVFILTPFLIHEVSAVDEDPSGSIEVGPGKDYIRISDALDNASSGDTIFVHPGTYFEHIVIEKEITIRGSGVNETFIDGSGMNSTIMVMHDMVTITDVTIQNSGKNETKGLSGLVAYEAGIWVSANFLSVMNCNFRNNSRVSIYFDHEGDHTSVIGCSFNGSTMNHLRFGTKSIEYVSILNNHFFNDGYQIVFYGPNFVGHVLIINNDFTSIRPNGYASAAITFSFWWEYETMRDSVVANNYIFGAKIGIFVNAGLNTEIAYNTLKNCSESGLKVDTSRNVSIHHNNFIGCGGDGQGWNDAEPVDWNLSHGAGNYWDDYEARYPGAHNDGEFWDTPYLIDGTARAFDRKPLVKPDQGKWSGKLPPDIIVPTDPINVFVGESFFAGFTVVDPDTLPEDLVLSKISGPDWVKTTSPDSVHGFVPGTEDPGLVQVEIRVSDGDNEAQATIFLHVLPKRDLVGYWDLSESGSRTAYDLSGYKNHGVLAGNSKWYGGLHGSAVMFEGVGSSIEVQDSNSLDLTSEYTFSLCVFPTEKEDQAATLLQKGNDPAGEGSWRLSLTWDTGGTVDLWKGYIGSRDYNFRSDGTIGMNEWSYISLTFDGTTVRLYINGELDTQWDQNMELPVTEDPLIFGDREGSSRDYVGLMDEVRIYNYALGAPEISSLYKELLEEMIEIGDPSELQDWTDSDEDDLPDFWEEENFGDLGEGANDDPDGDGFTNREEYEDGSDPLDINDPVVQPDSDGDGLPDAWEIEFFGGIYQEAGDDYDGDGLTEYMEYMAGTDPTDPYDPEVDEDSDNDDLMDVWELQYFGNLEEGPGDDPDNDGFDNFAEFNAGTDPTDPTDHPPEIIYEPPPPSILPMLMIIVASIILILVAVVAILFIIMVLKKKEKEKEGEIKKIDGNNMRPNPRIISGDLSHQSSGPFGPNK